MKKKMHEREKSVELKNQNFNQSIHLYIQTQCGNSRIFLPPLRFSVRIMNSRSRIVKMAVFDLSALISRKIWEAKISDFPHCATFFLQLPKFQFFGKSWIWCSFLSLSKMAILCIAKLLLWKFVFLQAKVLQFWNRDKK